MIREGDEDDAELLGELRNYLSDMQDPADPERQQMLRTLTRLVELCVETDARGQNLGMVSAIRTTTILRVLAAELTGREITLEMPGVVTFHPGEVDRRGQ